jgi:hypothetical protein
MLKTPTAKQQSSNNDPKPSFFGSLSGLFALNSQLTAAITAAEASAPSRAEELKETREIISQTRELNQQAKESGAKIDAFLAERKNSPGMT